MIKVHFPIRADVTLNSRAHWSHKARKAREHKDIVGWMLKNRAPPTPPFVIRLIRVGPRRMDQDNFVTSLKAVQDGVAAWIGIDDGKLTWEYEQLSGPYGVIMEIDE